MASKCVNVANAIKSLAAEHGTPNKFSVGEIALLVGMPVIVPNGTGGDLI